MKLDRQDRMIRASSSKASVADLARIMNYRKQAADMMARAQNAKSEDIRATYQILADRWIGWRRLP
jgi:hypothetical protein